jgi:HEAT repeat protein
MRRLLTLEDEGSLAHLAKPDLVRQSRHMHARHVAFGMAVTLGLASCAKTEKPPDILALVGDLRDPHPEVRTRAMLEILRVGEPAALAVAALLDDPAPRTRVTAAQTLWSLGPKAKPAVPRLAAALHDPLVEVRAAVATLCEALGPAAAPVVPALAGALRDEDWNVRQHAAIALGNIGPAAAAAVPALEEAAKDDFLRGAASEAMRKIQRPR